MRYEMFRKGVYWRRLEAVVDWFDLCCLFKKIGRSWRLLDAVHIWSGVTWRITKQVKAESINYKNKSVGNVSGHGWIRTQPFLEDLFEKWWKECAVIWLCQETVDVSLESINWSESDTPISLTAFLALNQTISGPTSSVGPTRSHESCYMLGWSKTPRSASSSSSCQRK